MDVCHLLLCTHFAFSFFFFHSPSFYFTHWYSSILSVELCMASHVLCAKHDQLHALSMELKEKTCALFTITGTPVDGMISNLISSSSTSNETREKKNEENLTNISHLDKNTKQTRNRKREAKNERAKKQQKHSEITSRNEMFTIIKYRLNVFYALNK